MNTSHVQSEITALDAHPISRAAKLAKSLSVIDREMASSRRTGRPMTVRDKNLLESLAWLYYGQPAGCAIMATCDDHAVSDREYRSLRESIRARHARTPKTGGSARDVGKPPAQRRRQTFVTIEQRRQLAARGFVCRAIDGYMVAADAKLWVTPCRADQPAADELEPEPPRITGAEAIMMVCRKIF